MELLPYAWFIIVLATPFLVIAAIAAAFIAGIAGIAAAIGGRWSGALVGVVLIASSGTTAAMIRHWATSPPTDAATSAHRVVHRTYKEMRMQLARRWLHAGTFSRLVEEQQRIRDSVQSLPADNDGVAALDMARMRFNESTP
jgi:thiol:disulfide interchange protein